METSYKDRIITLLLSQHGTERRVWEGLSNEHKNAQGTLDSWAVKDHIVHVTYWREVYTQRVRSASNGGEALPPDEDYLKTNDAVFKKHKEDAWDSIIEWAYKAQENLIEAVEALSEDMLHEKESFEWTNQRPLWQHIAFGEGYHPYAHLCDVLLLTNDFEQAEAIQLDLFGSLSALDDTESWQGNQVYNLACFYALHEHSARAIELLEQSFGMNPDLIEWSKEDSDLDSLRALPDFQALYPKEAA